MSWALGVILRAMAVVIRGVAASGAWRSAR
jgi:hypothetical protein